MSFFVWAGVGKRCSTWTDALHTLDTYRSLVRFLWVDQNQTYRQETSGGYLWSTKRSQEPGSIHSTRACVRSLQRTLCFPSVILGFGRLESAKGIVTSAPSPWNLDQRV